MNIELRDIRKYYGAIRANDGISLAFTSGKIIGILGENGAGKSTLMKILSGYQHRDGGQILLDGRPVVYDGPQTAIQHGIGMLQQDPLDVGAFTVLENFMYGQPLDFVLPVQTARQELAAISQRFGFDLDPDTPISQVSIGQRQQLEIVRLLTLGVRTLILDEPTTGISAEQKQILFRTLKALAAEDTVTVLLVSHKLEDVIALCDEVAVLRSGQVVGTLPMPATTEQLVTLMFGQEFAPQVQESSVKQREVALSFERVHLRGKRVTIRDFSLDILRGEVIGLAGLDGSGQELVLRACAGLEKCHHGRILVSGYNLEGKSYREFLKHGVAFGSAGRLEEGLVRGLTIAEHVALAADSGAFIDNRRVRALTDQAIRRFNVIGSPETPVESLSGGNQQRVLLSLLPEALSVLALENPTRGLDVDSARWVWQQLLARRRRGTAIIFSSPELDELVTYSDRILVFYAGEVFRIDNVDATSLDELGGLIGGQQQHSAGRRQ